MREILLDAPNLGELEKKYLMNCIDSTFVSTAGPFIPRFEEEFASYLNVSSAVSTQSGTSGLHLALHELGIKEGDEVIVPALTFVATVNPIKYVGAEPVFVDVDINTWNIDEKEIEKAITEKTKAIIPVHLYGNPCNMIEIIKIAKKHNLYVIEDATESLGASIENKATGTFGDFGVFSFNGNKVITTGGGGMVVSNETSKIEHIRFLINQARDVSKGYYHTEVGFNYRMTNLEASLGIAQMQRLEEFLNKKNSFRKIYKEVLGNTGKIKFQSTLKEANSSNWLISILFEENIDVEEIQKKLKEKNIPTRRIFMPIVEFPPYKRCRKLKCNNAYEIYKRGLNLPSSTVNDEEDIKYVASVIKNIIQMEG